MAKSAILCFAILALVLIAYAPQESEAAITCTTVANAMTPCINYVLYGGAQPSAACCKGARSINNQAKSTPDRRTVCSCLKSVATSATPAMINNAAQLPGKCGIRLGFKVGPSTDCAKIR